MTVRPPRRNRRSVGGEPISITSMMDMMTIILVFLLKSFTTDVVAIEPSAELQLPVSTSKSGAEASVTVVLTRTELLVDGELVSDVEETIDATRGAPTWGLPAGAMQGRRIVPLYDRLQERAAAARSLAAAAPPDALPFKGRVLLQCDKRLPFSAIRDVMFTANEAGFGEFRFVVIKGS